MSPTLRAATHAAAAARVSGCADVRPSPRAPCRAAGPPASVASLHTSAACCRRRRRHAAPPPRAALDVDTSRSRAGAPYTGAAQPLYSRLVWPAAEALSPAEARASSPQTPAAALHAATWCAPVAAAPRLPAAVATASRAAQLLYCSPRLTRFSPAGARWPAPPPACRRRPRRRTTSTTCRRAPTAQPLPKAPTSRRHNPRGKRPQR